MMKKVDVKELDWIFDGEGELGVVREVRVDFRKMQVGYSCEAEGNEELCLRYSPGPGGKCSHQDFSTFTQTCNANGFWE